MEFIRKQFLIIGVLLGCMFLLILKTGLFNSFFFTGIVGNQGIDYFALPKGFLNLLEGRSIFDTWGGTPFGPYATWYIAHPAFAVMIMPFFSMFPTWISYWLFVIFSMGLMLISAYFFSRFTENIAAKIALYFIIIFSFPTYLMLYVGNMHAPVIIALSLLFVAIYLLIRPIEHLKFQWFFIAALLISLFSKPVLLIMLPAFFIIEKTRKITLYVSIFYAVISLLFIVIPLFNPEGVGISELFSLTLEHLQSKRNIYTTGFQLTPLMKDNFMHWVNLISMSDYYFKHIEIFGSATFVNDVLGFELPKFIYKVPVLLSVLGSLLLLKMKENTDKFYAFLYLIMSISLTVFISYNLVWEYQYASVTPLFAMVLILFLNKEISKSIFIAISICAIWFYLPSPFFIFHDNWTNLNTNLLHATRALPVLVLYVIFYSLFLSKMYYSLKSKSLS